MVGLPAMSQWQDWMLFTNRQSFGIADPLFNQDVSFYMFQMPFAEFVVNWLFGALILIVLVVSAVHYLNGGIRLQVQGRKVTPQAKAHLSVLFAGLALVRALQDEGFDPAFTLDAPLGTFFTIPIEFMGWTRDTPVLPLFVNSYVPPQPSPERCFAFGQALARAMRHIGKRAVLIASGGMSHYPGTAVYAEPGPDNHADRKIFENIANGNLRSLLSLDENVLDATGNIELRSWLILAGVVGERRPQVTSFEPTWHHNYGTMGWTDLSPQPAPRLWYTAHPTRRVELARALHALRTEESAARAWLADAQAFGTRFDLTPEEAAALAAMDEVVMRDQMGMHALLTSGALRHLDRVRKTIGTA